jgi:hypothetical protein
MAGKKLRSSQGVVTTRALCGFADDELEQLLDEARRSVDETPDADKSTDAEALLSAISLLIRRGHPLPPGVRIWLSEILEAWSLGGANRRGKLTRFWG